MTFLICLSAVLTAALVVTTTLLWRTRRDWRQLQEAVDAGANDRAAFVARLSSEIRNPLNAVLGLSAQLVLPGAGVSGEQLANLTVVRAAAEQLHQVATNLEVLTLGTSALPPPDPRTVDVAALIDDVRLVVMPAALERKIQVSVELEAGAPRMVRLDLDLVRALLINIVSYAVALSEKRAVEVTVCELATGPGGRRGLKIMVLDSAPSMSEAARRAVFEPRPAGGLIEPLSTAGMGWHLPVARLMADHLGGALAYTGHRSGGGIFELWLPIEAADQLGPAQFTGSRVVALNTIYTDHQERVPSLRVLVVEDQKSNQIFIETILTKAGHRCELVANSDEALAILRRAHYDLVLLDLRLPGRPGLDVLRMVRLGMSTADVNVPVVVLTGESQPEVREACMAAGATDFLAKPISATKLLGTIELVAESRLRGPRSTAGLDDDAPPMPEHLAELFRDIMRYSDELDAHASHSDWPQVRFTAKAIRGTCQSLELPGISRVCRMIADADDHALISGFSGFRDLLDRSIREAEISIRHSLTPQ